MPPEHNRQLSALSRYRLEAARAVLADKAQLSLALSNEPASTMVAELCDAYAMVVLLGWLAARFNFPTPDLRADRDCPADFIELDKWNVFCRQYPFADCRVADLKVRSAVQAIEMLNGAFKPDVYLIGSLYEQICGRPLYIDKHGGLRLGKNENRKQSGQYYTPRWIVNYCLERAWSQESNIYLQKFKKSLIASPSVEPAMFEPVKILDPACGTGNFLIGALEWMSTNGLSGANLLNALSRSFYGIDLDGRAVALCRLALVLSAAGAIKEHKDALGADSAEQMLTTVCKSLRKNIVVGDSLLNASLLSEFRENHAFDLVITNPPYISFGARNQQVLPASASRYLRKAFPDSSQYKIRLHSLFQEVALRYCRDGGAVVLFLPDAFLTGSYYSKLRAKLLRDVYIESLSELPEHLINDAAVGRWCVASYKVARNQKPQKYDLELFCLGQPAKSAGKLRKQSGQVSSSKPGRQQYRLAIETFVSPDRGRFRLMFHDLDRDIWLKMDELPPLSSVLRGHTGIRARAGQSSIISKTPDGIAMRRGITSGSPVRRHCINGNTAWLNIDAGLLYAGGFDPSIVERPKLMVRQTADRIIAAYDETGLYHLNNVHSFSTVPARMPFPDLHFYDGLMNSSFWFYLYQLKSREAGRALAQIDIEMVEAMPLPPAASDLSRLISRLTCIARRLYGILPAEQSVNQGEQEGFNLLSFVERSIDKLVYDLYNLSVAQVARVESYCRSGLPFDGDLPSRKMIEDRLPCLENTGISIAVNHGGGSQCAGRSVSLLS